LTIFLHDGVNWEIQHEKNSSILPEPDNASNEEEREIFTIIKRSIERDPRAFRNIAEGITGVSEETTTGVLRLCEKA